MTINMEEVVVVQQITLWKTLLLLEKLSVCDVRIYREAEFVMV